MTVDLSWFYPLTAGQQIAIVVTALLGSLQVIGFITKLVDWVVKAILRHPEVGAARAKFASAWAPLIWWLLFASILLPLWIYFRPEDFFQWLGNLLIAWWNFWVSFSESISDKR